MIITFPRFCFGHQEQKNKMAEMKLSIRRRGEDQSRRQTGRAVSVFSGRRVVIKRTRGWGGREAGGFHNRYREEEKYEAGSVERW